MNCCPSQELSFGEVDKMAKKIVVLTGSPRKNGNSIAMAEAFIAAAKNQGHQVTRFDTAQLQINGCRACETCFSKGQACSFDDDFNKIAPAIEEADVIVFSMPVYWYTMPAQIKAPIDKLFSFVVGKRDIAGKRCALLACCEEDDLSVLDGVLMPYQKSISLLKWTSIGEVLVPGVYAPGDIDKTDGKAQAAALVEVI